MVNLLEHIISDALQDYEQPKFDLPGAAEIDLDETYYYLKCLEINPRDNESANGSYGYLLYLMGQYNEGLKYIKIELEIGDDDIWPFVYGLIIKMTKHWVMMLKQKMHHGVL